MSSIIRWWADNKVAANLLMIALIIAGIVAYLRMERELEPYVEFPGAQISVVWRGASPQDIEEQITVRMEEAVSSVEGIKELRSYSNEGVATLVVIGNQDLDEGKFLEELKRQIDSISTFPAAAEPPQLQVFRSRSELMRIAVSGDETVSEQTLKHFAEATRREIGLLGHVPAVELFGVRNEEISIEVSEEELRRYGVSLAEVAQAVGGTSVNISARQCPQ